MAQTIKNTKGVKVQTPTGMKNFSGMSKSWHEQVVEIVSATRKITCGMKHKFLVEPGWVDAEHIEPGMSFTTIDGKDDPILSVQVKNDPQWLYDLLDVEGGSAYITEGVISHNCEFISSDALLMDSLKLSYIKATPPVTQNMGFNFWRESIGGRGKTYLVGVDPATGNSKDFTVIEVIEYPSMEQVAEFRSNTVHIPLIYAKLKWLFKFLHQPDPNRGRAEIIWSFERNGVGEALVAMIQNDDSMDGGIYLDGVELYNESSTSQRLGCYTTGKSKLLACMQLKNLLEKGDGIKINSEHLLYELQNFVAVNGTYQAKQGCTDDTIMAMAVVMKVLGRLASYDDKARKLVYESVDPDSDKLPEENPDQFGDDYVPFAIV
jgi:hypothetical protein